MLEVLSADDFRTARFPPARGLDVRNVLQEMINEAASRISNREYVTATFAPVFGATTLCPRYEPFPFGMQRKSDLCILTHVVNQLAQRRDETPLKVLEIAAGRSYGDFYHRGAPWLSRLIKLALGRFVDITITDFCTSDVNVFAVDSKKQLHSLCLNRFTRSFAGIVPMSPGLLLEPRHNLQFGEKSALDLRQRFPDFTDALVQSLGAEIALPFLTPGRDALNAAAKFFIRPALDSTFENSVYGLSVNNNVDMSRVADYFPPGSFDVIFARHMAPTFFRSRDPLIRTAEKLVKPTGVVLLNAGTVAFRSSI